MIWTPKIDPPLWGAGAFSHSFDGARTWTRTTGPRTLLGCKNDLLEQPNSIFNLDSLGSNVIVPLMLLLYHILLDCASFITLW